MRIQTKYNLEDEKCSYFCIKHCSIDTLILLIIYHESIRNKFENRQKDVEGLNKFTPVHVPSTEIIRNLSSTALSMDKLNLLCFGLKFSILPLKLQKTNIFVSIEKTHQFIQGDIHNEDKPALKTHLSHLTNYKPTRGTLKKHSILQKRCKDNSIVILKPDKENGVAVLNHLEHDEAILGLN